MNLPSKELLSAVLSTNDCKPHKIQDTDLWFESEVDQDYRLVWTNDSINIYELAHKCKEWARDKGYLLYSLPDLCIVKTLNLEYCVDFGLSTEAESIFRACQWILDNKEQK